jgi:hypothetical protein
VVEARVSSLMFNSCTVLAKVKMSVDIVELAILEMRPVVELANVVILVFNSVNDLLVILPSSSMLSIESPF